jgi:hypothetical protein
MSTNQRDRTLGAHLAIEGLLESMLETVLPRPKYWMETADYKSKVSLALSMGLIGEKERTICQVINKARNAMAHSVDPLPEKWRIEMHRLAQGLEIHKSDPKDLNKIVMGLMVKITAPFLYTRRRHYIKNVMKNHPDLWNQLLYKKMDERPDLEKLPVDIEAWRPLLEDIERQLLAKARENEKELPPRS